MRPWLIALAGPNGAGKSTAGPMLVRDALGVLEYVDADAIARGLSAFEPEGAAIAAGRVMLKRLRDLGRNGGSFAFESTMASRTFAPWIADLTKAQYAFCAIYLWLPSADLAVLRVRDRVSMGGHAVPEVDVRRRYERGLHNFFELYRPLATRWRVYDNSGASPSLVAAGSELGEVISQAAAWGRIREQVERA